MLVMPDLIWPDPLFIDKGEGAYLYDVDGNRFLDYLASWGPLILGHCHPEVVAAAETAVRKGSSFGAPTPGEVEMAQLIVAALPSVEVVRMVGTILRGEPTPNARSASPAQPPDEALDIHRFPPHRPSAAKDSTNASTTRTHHSQGHPPSACEIH